MRYLKFLRQRYAAILNYTGIIAFIIGLLILCPLLCLLFYPHEAAIGHAFWGPALIIFLLGGIFVYLSAPTDTFDLTYQEASVIIVISWAMAVLAGALPFMIGCKLGFTQAVFESTSGWTTTGLSVVDVESAAHLVLFYRSILQFAGGAGFAIIMLSALVGPSGTGLSAAEGQKAQLAPNIKRSAELVLSFYGCYALTGAVCFHLAGMQWFDAVNHSLTAVSTGGFSTRLMSIGYWDSPAVEATAMILMLLGGTNFLTSYLLLKRKFSFLKRNGELRLESALLVLSLPLLFWEVTQPIYADLSKALRVALFEAVSAVTTTGFSCTAYGQWPDSGCLVLIGLMLIGGGTGSTAGGLKQYRIYILYRGLLWELRRLLLPKQAVTEPDVWHGEERRFISDKDLRQTGMFVFLYFIVFATGSVIIATYGFSLKQALFEFASALGTVGLSLGITAAQAPAGMLWTQIAGMFFGRLEFFAVIVGTVKLVSDMRIILVINKKNAAD